MLLLRSQTSISRLHGHGVQGLGPGLRIAGSSLDCTLDFDGNAFKGMPAEQKAFGFFSDPM